MGAGTISIGLGDGSIKEPGSPIQSVSVPAATADDRRLPQELAAQYAISG